MYQLKSPFRFAATQWCWDAIRSAIMSSTNGYAPPKAGQVLINGRSLYQHFDEFRGMIGFVPQDDIIHSELTVREALFFSARLRLPKDFTNRDIHKRIGDVLAQLGLSGIDDVLIGSPTRKGISGGDERQKGNPREPSGKHLMTTPVMSSCCGPSAAKSRARRYRAARISDAGCSRTC